MIFDNLVYFSSSARLPQSAPSSRISGIVNIGIVIYFSSGEIVDVTTTFISKGATNFLKQIVVGFNLNENNIDDLIEIINYRYHGESQKAITVSIKSSVKKYFEWLHEENK